MLASGESAGAAFAQEYIGLVFHGLTVSHIDAVSHYFWDGRIYNGRPRESVNTQQGATFGVCYDRCLPSVVAFGNRAEAAQFEAAHGGKLVGFGELLQE